MHTPRDLVKRTLEFASPSRAPRQLWLLPWAVQHYPEKVADIQRRFPDDIVSSPGFLQQKPMTSGDAYGSGLFVDEWGCVFENIQPGVIGEVKKPLIGDWGDLSKLRPPEELLTVDVDQVNAFCRGTEKFVLAGACPRPFERLQFIRKSENVYLDLGQQSAEFLDLLHRVHEFFLRDLEIWADTEVDGLSFMDDWGSQRALLISPAQWRRLFKPLYKEYIEIAHSHGKYAFMHSDGYTEAIIGDLIEIGLDALNTQLFTMDIEALGRRFRGKLTFWGEIDRQHLLPRGTTQEIAAAVHRVRDAFWADGGAIAQCEFGAGAKPENVWQVFETWDDLGDCTT